MEVEQVRGQPSPERASRRANARQLSRAALSIAVAMTVWGIYCPQPYEVVIAALAVLPWCGLLIIARSHGFFHADDKGIYRGIAALAALPALVLALRALQDVHLLVWWEALPLTAIGAAAFIFIVTKADHRLAKRRGGITGMLCVACAYAYGISAEADMLLDPSPPQSFTPTVLDKHTSGGFRNPRTYHFTVGPWGPRREADNITVSMETFHAIKRGEAVCISLRPGALWIPWYVSETC